MGRAMEIYEWYGDPGRSRLAVRSRVEDGRGHQECQNDHMCCTGKVSQIISGCAFQ